MAEAGEVPIKSATPDHYNGPILNPAETAAKGIGKTVRRWLFQGKEHVAGFLNHLTLQHFAWTSGWSIGAGVGGGLALLAGAELWRRHRRNKRARAAQQS